MYKILFLTQFAQIGGGETMLLSLLKKLNRRKFEPVVILPQNGQLSRELKKLNIETYYLYLTPYTIRTIFLPGVSPVGIYRLYSVAKKLKPDLIHLNHLTLAIYTGIAAKLLSASVRIPIVATAHGPWDSYYFYQDIVTNFFVDKILANTPDTSQKLLKRGLIKKSKVVIAPFGIDTNIFKPPVSHDEKHKLRELFNLPSDDIVVTIVGRLDPVKDHLTLLKAANLVQAKYPNVTFWVVGSKLGDFAGQKSNYLDSIRNYQQSDPDLLRKVIFSGFFEDMQKVYSTSDILVSSSLSESFGLGLAEGAACSVPIVSTNSGGQRYIVKNGKTGFLAPPKRPDILAEKILTLAKNPKLRTQFGKNGRQHIIKNFPIEKYVTSVENTYLTLLKNRYN